MNYFNLSDVEFEHLCADVMSRMLGKPLERFGTGRDNGIDLTDNSYKKNIVVQVKRYVKTDVNGLLRSLRGEVEKVKALNPNEYYICCSKELTPQNKQEIFGMFSEYMQSPQNIVTTIELDDFLARPENTDILRKHFKLWLDSTNILTDMLSNEIFIDSETLIAGIEQEVKLFVKTNVFDKALDCLSKRNVLLIVGNPGVGKTVTSKMLVLHYAMQGYRVRYTTDSADLNALKKSLSSSGETKEIVLLDDCFGQAYFNMKETMGAELLSLIKYVSLHKNKLLILNSRISIYNEANERTMDLKQSFSRKEYQAYILNVDNMSTREKGEIFYNHLFFSEIGHEHFENIRANRNYRRIVLHPNYNPRVIEFVCSRDQVARVDPSEYTNFILDCLNNPHQIWLNEYERRLDKADRMLLTTIYSLTETTAPYALVQQCYEYRISKTPGIDPSINHFQQSLKRLLGSMVMIVDVKGEKMVKVANPSVNDFLRVHLSENQPEKNELIRNSTSVQQFNRLLENIEYESRISTAFADHSILSFVFLNEQNKQGFIAYWCAKNNIQDSHYRSYVRNYIENIRDVTVNNRQTVFATTILHGLLQKEMMLFYGLDEMFLDTLSLIQILENLQIEEQIEIVEQTNWLFEGEQRNAYAKIVKPILKESAEWYCSDVPFDAYDLSVSDVIDDFRSEDEFGGRIDSDGAIDALENMMRDAVADELFTMFSKLPPDITLQTSELETIHISVSGVSSAVESYLRDDYDDDAYEAYREAQYHNGEILDRIFN